MSTKADYVRSQVSKGAGKHHCHWPGCETPVPPAMWGCKMHWYKLPAALRAKVWAAYRPGQEISKTPSASYIAVAKEVQEWIFKNVRPGCGNSDHNVMAGGVCRICHPEG